MKTKKAMDFCSTVAVKLLLEGVDEDKNLLTSPLSYNAIMNMIACGSSGETLDQILQFLQHKNIEEVNSEASKFTEITSEEPKRAKKRKIYDVAEGRVSTKIHKSCETGEAPIINFLNGVWVNQNYRLKDSFQELLQNLYKAKAENIDCGKPGVAVREINEWASASTKGLINQVLQEQHITVDTTLILGNALYFKGSWKGPFRKRSTKCDSFYLLNGVEIQAPFMTGCRRYSVMPFRGFQVARIPYSTGGDVIKKFAMYIFLPNKKDGLKSLLNKVESNPEFFKKHCDPLKGCGKVDYFWIPKFKFSYLTEQSAKIMKGMGLTLPFDVEKAEMNEMIKEEDLPKHEKVYVSQIIQKAFIEVNEDGTEAAAVTFMSTMARRAPNPRPPTKFIADHPFMFIIREENSGIIFFIGTVLNPLED